MRLLNQVLGYKIILCIISIAILSSCKSRKKLVSEPTSEALTKDALIEKLKQPLHFEWYEAKAKIELESNYASEKGKLYLRMRKDSAILSAVKRYSVEGGRALITSDSVYYINRMDHTYQIAALDTLKDLYGLAPHFSYVENLFSGISPHTTEKIIETEELEHEIIIKVMINEMLHVMTYDRFTGKLTQVNFKDRFNISGNWEYSDYRYINDTLALPFYRKFNAELSPSESINLTLEFSNIELKDSGEIKFTIPENYHRLH